MQALDNPYGFRLFKVQPPPRHGCDDGEAIEDGRQRCLCPN